MMHLIGKTNIDFQSRRHFWMTLSGLCILAGIVSLILHGGPNYSIDFTGGLSIILRSHAPQGKPEITEEMVRNSLDQIGITGSEVKTSRSPEGEDLLVRIKGEGRFRPPEALIRNKLDEKFSTAWQVVPDEQLDPEGLDELSGFSYVAVKTAISQSDLISALRETEIDNPRILLHKTQNSEDVLILAGEGRDPVSRWRKQLDKEYPGYRFEIRSIEMVGPRIGAELRTSALLALMASWVLIIIYLWWRFDLVFGIAAVVALVHDVMITLGVLSFFNYEISMTVVGALLTLIGYSVNDTIVVFDRIRENLRRYRERSLKEIINESINQTLSRTIITNGTVFIVVTVLFLFGGEVLRGFAFAMVIGSIVGTYSSVYIASPILIDYVEKTGRQIGQRIKKQ
jgi:preprotein translocase subunit SecF